MLKRSLLRLLGSGRLPKQARHLIESETCQLLREGLVGVKTLKNFSAPNKRSSWRRQWFLGSIAISSKRVMVYRYGTCLLNVPYEDARFKQIDYSAEKPGVLSIVHDAALFHPAWSGEIEYSFCTPDAMQICSSLASHSHKARARQSNRAPAR